MIDVLFQGLSFMSEWERNCLYDRWNQFCQINSMIIVMKIYYHRNVKKKRELWILTNYRKLKIVPHNIKHHSKYMDGKCVSVKYFKSQQSEKKRLTKLKAPRLAKLNHIYLILIYWIKIVHNNLPSSSDSIDYLSGFEKWPYDVSLRRQKRVSYFQ